MPLMKAVFTVYRSDRLQPDSAAEKNPGKPRGQSFFLRAVAFDAV